MLEHPEKQLDNKVGLPDNVIVMSEERFAKALASMLVIPEIIIIDVIVDTRVELTPEPIVNMLTPPSDDGIVIALTVEPVICVIPVRVGPDKLKIKLYPAAINSEEVNPLVNPAAFKFVVAEAPPTKYPLVFKLCKEVSSIFKQPEKQLAPNVGKLDKVMDIIPVAFLNASDAIEFTAVLNIILFIPLISVKGVDPVPILCMVIPPSETGIESTVASEPLTLVTLVSLPTLLLIPKIKSYPAVNNCCCVILGEEPPAVLLKTDELLIPASSI
jgi:hypothetical protein